MVPSKYEVLSVGLRNIMSCPGSMSFVLMVFLLCLFSYEIVPNLFKVKGGGG